MIVGGIHVVHEIVRNVVQMKIDHVQYRYQTIDTDYQKDELIQIIMSYMLIFIEIYLLAK